MDSSYIPPQFPDADYRSPDLFDLKPLNEILEEVDTTPDISLSFSV